MNQPRAADQHRERRDAVRRDATLLLATAQDRRRRGRSRARRARRRPPPATDRTRAARRLSIAVRRRSLREIRRFGRRQRDSLRRRGLLNARRSALRGSTAPPRHSRPAKAPRAGDRVESSAAGTKSNTGSTVARRCVALLRQLRLGFRNAERERRDHVVRSRPSPTS